MGQCRVCSRTLPPRKMLCWRLKCQRAAGRRAFTASKRTRPKRADPPPGPRADWMDRGGLEKGGPVGTAVVYTRRSAMWPEGSEYLYRCCPTPLEAVVLAVRLTTLGAEGVRVEAWPPTMAAQPGRAAA